ncbi:hypothetical protein QUF64_05245 [Anaerolineales bacterium HSG6]|nr:hypothetical protein [Anaerolineales bacterium HSG6]
MNKPNIIRVSTFAVSLILLSLTALVNTSTVHAQEPTSENLELASPHINVKSLCETT